jgi:hypothetical protein
MPTGFACATPNIDAPTETANVRVIVCILFILILHNNNKLSIYKIINRLDFSCPIKLILNRMNHYWNSLQHGVNTC